MWAVETEETVTVVAGTFRAFKITSGNKNTGALIYERNLAFRVMLPHLRCVIDMPDMPPITT